ncbi:SDR family NAD(P)-dependent oxidoreductase [Cohnella terricola]|uniref:SDR family NAD(P)-dependent oxidoreductase n=1 Tax=Cohnella terricola TaxID=1289167 RepID=A0A559JDN9_9BACL|nr:SDR family NAD(P)-dependent oxidoreductase [Cohnella terricola]TVX97985.1 SDR family NAD(P)-dependent oxidoreductase [Cohnella terricola]
MSKVACVTGADYGLGLELSAGLLERGYKVFAGRYCLEDGEGLTALKSRYGEQLLTVHMDVSDDASVSSAADWIKERTETIDVLINNAAKLGDIQQTIFGEPRFQEMLDVYNVNAVGPLRVAHALIQPHLRSETKLIMNISSEAGSIGDCWRTNWFAYAMSKAALNMETALLHKELEPLGTSVISVHPGWVRTYMQGKLDEAATYTSAEAASHILNLAERPDLYKSETPLFVDLLGNPLPW